MSARLGHTQSCPTQQAIPVRHHGIHPAAVGDPCRDGRMNRIGLESRQGWCRAVMPGEAQAVILPDDTRGWYR
ncbi:MAG: hypothetical protein KatS3mg056_1124 [Chloroflexus sp.]|nr:MAG: hypothetical protein KatS3mg056_1124 [Chloroflexus sp.]